MTEIYGVDTEKEVTPIMVRDAIMKCFSLAHKEIMDKEREEGIISETSKDEEVGLIVKQKFQESGADWDNPSRQDILQAMEKLADFAKQFRHQEIVERHFNQIMTLFKSLRQ